MSNIGIPAHIQGQPSSKGKAGGATKVGGQAKVEGSFANTIANIAGRGGEGDRKGSRLSISESSLRPLGQSRSDQADQVKGGKGLAAEHDAAISEDATLPEVAGPDASGRLEVREGADRPSKNVLHDRRSETRNVDERPTDDTVDPESVETTRSDIDAESLLRILAVRGESETPASGAVADGDERAQVLVAASREGAVQADGKASRQDRALPAASGAEDAADDGAVQESDRDQLFRLMRADGKGREVDLSLSAGGDRASFREAEAGGPRGEAVTVVDARRYIGLAQQGNAGAITSAITQDPTWTTSLSATSGLAHIAQDATARVVNTLKIQMHPIELGNVTATLRLSGDELVVSLQVETREAYRQLTSEQDAIVKALRAQGFAVEQVSVQLVVPDRAAAQQGDGQSQQQQLWNQQQAREGGDGRQGGGQRESGGFENNGSSREDGSAENGPAPGGGQPVRSGSVYL